MINIIVIGEYGLLLLAIYQKLIFLLAQDHMGLEISKDYSSYSFHPMSAKLYEYIAYHEQPLL